VRILREALGKRSGAEVGGELEEMRKVLSGFDYQRAQTEPAAQSVNTAREFLKGLTARLFPA